MTRPNDGNNLWGQGNNRGFFLELPEGYGRARSGDALATPVPIFYDLQSFRGADGLPRVVVYYWFFYIYNYFVVFQHEGDWEHVSLYFQAESPESLGETARPSHIYYSTHDTGELYLADRGPIEWFDDAGSLHPQGTHPGVYVSPWGHPSYPTKSPEFRKRKRLSQGWRTWNGETGPRNVADQRWALYDGAWGEVGWTTHSTGPLGPIFKRVDEVARGKVRNA